MREFVDAFNAGDGVALDRLVGHGPLPTEAFQWVAWPDKTEYTPVATQMMLREHWARGERITLMTVEAGAGPSWHGGIDFALRLQRSLPYQNIRDIVGKGALSCAGRRIYVLALEEQP